MTVISSLGFVATSAAVTVTAVSQNPQLRLFRSTESNWVITKEDLDSANSTFSKITANGNFIGFEKSDYSVKNLNSITGLESVTCHSTNNYLQVSTGFREDSFLHERYFKNDRANEFNISLTGERYIQIS